MKQSLQDRSAESLLDNSAFLIMEVGRLYRLGFDQRVRGFGLSRSEWWLISHIWFFEGRTQQELADILDITKGGMAKLIKRLEEKGVIERRADSREGRATKRVHLTEKGKPLASKVDAISVKFVRDSESLLDAGQVKALHESLRNLRLALLKPSKSSRNAFQI